MVYETKHAYDFSTQNPPPSYDSVNETKKPPFTITTDGYPHGPPTQNIVVVCGNGITCPKCQALGSFIPTQTKYWNLQLIGCFFFLGLIGLCVGVYMDKPRRCVSCGFEEENGTKPRGMCLFLSGLLVVAVGIGSLIGVAANNAIHNP